MSEKQETIRMTYRTDIGSKRSENQDYIAHFENQAGLVLVVLADGMGGHRAGNVASQMAATDLGNLWKETDLTALNDIKHWLLTEIEVVNQSIHEKGQEDDYRGMGTTIEAVVIYGHHVIYGHVGDSRIGHFHENHYEQVTSDHSLVNELVQAGQITEEEAAVHPQKNIITQSIGQAHPVMVDVGVEILEANDILVVNSDGLTNMVSTAELEEVLRSSQTLDEKAQTLIDLANQAGGLDNISVVLVQAESEEEL